MRKRWVDLGINSLSLFQNQQFCLLRSEGNFIWHLCCVCWFFIKSEAGYPIIVISNVLGFVLCSW